MNGGEDDEGCQGMGEDALEGEEEEEGVGQGEEGQAGGEGAAGAEDHRVRPDAVPDVALVVADLLGQVAGGEGEGEEGGRGEAATVDGVPQGVAEEEVEGATG